MRTKRTFDYVRETHVWCASCQQLLRHDRHYCPLFPNTVVAGHDKWSRCCCLTHTCYDNPLKLVYVGFVRGHSAHYGRLGSDQTLCGRKPVLVGPPVTEPFREDTCKRCVVAFFKRAGVYCDRP